MGKDVNIFKLWEKYRACEDVGKPIPRGCGFANDVPEQRDCSDEMHE